MNRRIGDNVHKWNIEYIMNTEARFSIKQRLKSANNSLAQPTLATHTASTRKIRVPEHYNYFIATISKQLRHEEHVYRNIRKKIDTFKARQNNGKLTIKNACTFSHKSFISSSLKNSPFHNRKIQAKTAYHSPDGQTLQFTDPNLSRQDSPSGKSTSSFVRSQPYTDFYCSSKENDPLWEERRVQTGKGRYRKNKDGVDLELMGGRPQWNNFQSYRIYKGSALNPTE